MALRGDPVAAVVVVGSVNRDLVCQLDRWPDVGETVNARETRFGSGGKGANQAIAAARMGCETVLIGAIGGDGFCTDVLADLAGLGLNLALRRVEGISTGLAFIDIGPDGGNIIRLAQGANAHLGADDVADHAAAIHAARVVLLQNETPLTAALAAARLARKGGAIVVMDPAPAPLPMWADDIMGHFDILTPNATEAGLITGHVPATLDEAVAVARSLGRFHAAALATTRRGAIDSLPLRHEVMRSLAS